jgi:hypothetical protein
LDQGLFAPAHSSSRAVHWQEEIGTTGKAMIRSSHQGRKDKAIAEVLTMIADTHPELAPQVIKL